ncbi:sigma-54-dependent transcriptional regulator [Planctomicrobium sp. SH664]|uniref:sigma-54-dependent transcriptional regulator n=1 Tax=Planctomicrobium sp. SH664 TaxID=3448125 RepID=UPI003F5BA3E8
MSRILVIDDEPAICWAFDQALSDQGHEVCIASTAESALSEIERFEPDAILLDYRLPGMNGLSALKQLRETRRQTPVVLMTAFGSLDLAVDALGEGAFDYLPKPFDLEDAVQLVSRALASRTAKVAPTAQSESPTGEIVGVSRGMQEVFRQVALVAQLDVPVLITGESGVGKELIARAIHRYSGREAGKFVPICVPALNETVLESELFGHVKGAFTGAERSRQGLLVEADGGTAFFDEIGDIPLLQQVKLLRVLDDRKVVPVGSNEAEASQFRLIAATHRSLPDLVSVGRFREDLYYRLSVFQIRIPPLRERPEDIRALAERFLKQSSGDRELEFSSEALQALTSRPWPGNVRELRSAVQHAAIVCRGGLITPDCFPATGTPRPDDRMGNAASILPQLKTWAHQQLPLVNPSDVSSTLYERFLDAFEPPILTAALEAAGGSRKAAADLLGLHRETLRKRLRKHGLAEPDSGD